MSSGLNSQQKIAVEHVEGPALVLAGAGSGKTRVVTYRIANLLQIGVPASEIVAVTFTNKAAAEMRHRIERISRHFVLTCTFHSLCARILRESIHHLGYQQNFTIYDEDDSERLLKDCLASLQLTEEKGFLKTAKAAISIAKNSLSDPADANLRAAYALYQTRLKENQALDFDDLLYLVVRLLQEHPDVLDAYQKRWTFILIDEYQDTNPVQHALVKLLAQKHRNVFAVGDPDQSIYSWRGANVHNILRFEEDFPGARVISLEQNYRSCTTILNAANALIQHNESRYPKNLWSDRGSGEKICLYICENDRAEADFVVSEIKKRGLSLNECAVFYRTNFQSRVLEDALLKTHIPYVIIGGLSFYQRREIKDILSYLRMALGGADFLAFSRTVNIPKRGFGEAAAEKVREVALRHGISILDACVAICDRKIEIKLSGRQFEGLKSYVQLLLMAREMSNQHMALQEILSKVIQEARYVDYLREDPESFEERQSNLAELVTKAAEWEHESGSPSLAAFLEELALKSSSDQKDPPSDAVRLMTLHNGKGLEFSAVFLIGMEEDLFPHINAKDNPEALEEERRLCYVGMTRAKDFLYLSAARTRFLWGTPRMMRPSRFLAEIPPEYVQPRHGRQLEDGPQEFEPGDGVHHRDFGTGIVRKKYQTSLGLTYDVFFPGADIERTLVARFAKLSRG